MKKILLMIAVAMMTAMTAQAQTCPEGLSIDNAYSSGQDGYYYANLVKGQNVTVTLSETNFVFKVYDHGGKNGNYSSDYSGNTQSITFNAPEGCVFVVSGTINEIHGSASDRFELYDGQNSFYFYNGDDWAAIPNHVTTSNSLKISFSTAQATSGAGFELTVRVWDGWTEVSTESELTSAVADGAQIRLTADIPLSEYLQIGNGATQFVTLDLNGHTLSRSLTAADANGHVIEVFSQGNLTIVDSSGDRSGTITGGWANNGGGICNYGTLTIQGIRITGCKAAQQGGGIKNNAGATLTIISSIITGNSAPNGGGIYNIEGGTMTIEGNEVGTVTWSSISNNTATEDGGGIVNRGTAIISAGYFSGNQAANNGGGIWNSGTLSIATQNLSVEIKNNTCKGEGGGLWNSGTLNMQGVIEVKNNSNVTAGSMDSNLFLKNGTKINVTGLFAGACEIHVYTENYQTRVITSGYQNTNSWSNQFIKSDAEGFNIRYAGSELEFYQTASGTPIRYIDRSWDNGTVVATQRLGIAQNIADVLTGGGQKNLSGYYFVTGNVSKNDKLYASGDVHLILCDGASLTANCLINDEYSVHIYGQTAGTGQFTATNPDTGYPGIGCHSQAGKDIFIHGGVITVKGASSCAGIGGGYYTANSINYHQNCANIKIYGGTVNATGGVRAAGIGGSSWSSTFGYVYIYGGTVNAQGGDSPVLSSDGGGAGIGGGDRCPGGGYINIYGGTVNSTGGAEAAGIGVGQNTENVTPWDTQVSIHGGSVTATGGDRGAGIGGGDGVSGCNVFVYGGTVKAYAGTDAAGIGSGEGADANDGGYFEIRGGFVEAWGKDAGAGLGAGEDAAMGEIHINGGTLIAHGGSSSNAICSHKESGTNSFAIRDEMRLRISENILPTSARNNISSYKDIQIEPCTHTSVTYTVNGTTANDTHTMHCPHCSYSPTDKHTFEYGTCTVCQVSGSTNVVSIYLPEEVGGSYTDGHYGSTPVTQALVTGSTFQLPALPDYYLPTGYIFAGWRVGTPEGLGITAYNVGKNEEVLKAGTSYTVNADVNLTARYMLNINLANAADNSTTISTNNGFTANVTLSGRTLYRDSDWNTLCLPFDVARTGAWDGATVMELDTEGTYDGDKHTGFDATTGTLYLYFKTVSGSIVAGKPYIVKWIQSTNITDPVFNGVTINNSSEAIDRMTVTSTDGKVSFKGTYSPVTLTSGDKSKLFLGSDNNLYWPETDINVNACRAYFELSDGNAQVKSFVLNFGDEEATSLSEELRVKSEESADAWFSIDGRRLSGKPSKAGIYIHGNRKVVIK